MPKMGELVHPRCEQLSSGPELSYTWIADKYAKLCERWPEEFCYMPGTEVVSANSGRADDGAFWLNFTLHYEHESFIPF